LILWKLLLGPIQHFLLQSGMNRQPTALHTKVFTKNHHWIILQYDKANLKSKEQMNLPESTSAISPSRQVPATTVSRFAINPMTATVSATNLLSGSLM
jgi:hypothetical protein